MSVLHHLGYLLPPRYIPNSKMGARLGGSASTRWATVWAHVLPFLQNTLLFVTLTRPRIIGTKRLGQRSIGSITQKSIADGSNGRRILQ